MSTRSTLVTAVSIPLSLLITFIGLSATGYSLNILTLGALTIATVLAAILILRFVDRSSSSTDGYLVFMQMEDASGIVKRSPKPRTPRSVRKVASSSARNAATSAAATTGSR